MTARRTATLTAILAGLLATSVAQAAGQTDASDVYDPLSSIKAPVAGIATLSGAAYDPLSSIRVPVSLSLERTPVEFTGRMDFGEPISPETSVTSGSVTRNRGGVWETVVSDMSDPRLNGRLISAANMDIHPPSTEDGPPVFAFNEVIRIENERGAWQALPHVGFFSPGFTPEDAMADWTIVLIGEGDYAGLTAVAFLDSSRAETGGWIDVRGVVLAGGHPPQPATATAMVAR